VFQFLYIRHGGNFKIPGCGNTPAKTKLISYEKPNATNEKSSCYSHENLKSFSKEGN
jgi:hypothetical protein